ATQGVALFPGLVVRVAIPASRMAAGARAVVAVIVAVARRAIAAVEIVAVLGVLATVRCELGVDVAVATRWRMTGEGWACIGSVAGLRIQAAALALLPGGHVEVVVTAGGERADPAVAHHRIHTAGVAFLSSGRVDVAITASGGLAADRA